MSDWMPSLITKTPSEGYDLAEYAEESGALIAVSQVVATHFATVAAANGYWRES